MHQKAVIQLCKELGCCNACSLRYIGIKSQNAYGDSKTYILKYLDSPSGMSADPQPSDSDKLKNEDNSTQSQQNSNSVTDKETNSDENSSVSTRISESTESNGRLTPPPAKRKKPEICPSCVGILQEFTWPKSLESVKEQLDKKGYDCDIFACALSAPIATLLREKALLLHIKGAIPDYDTTCLTPLKEAWKWSFGVKLESYIGKTLISGSSSPLLITVAMEYPDEFTELEIVKTLSPSLFESRRQQRKRFTVELTRRSVEQALNGASLEALQRLHWRPAPLASAAAHCASVVCGHAPHNLAGRYIKLSRTLPQTPWLVGGQRMMASSVQETIFEPLARLYQILVSKDAGDFNFTRIEEITQNHHCTELSQLFTLSLYRLHSLSHYTRMSKEDVECRMKFMSAGREDVDVRCLGEGRPFAVEIADPRRQLTAEELQKACEQISSGGNVIVKQLVYVTKDDLSLLKKGEETKTKTYEALCIKLTHNKEDEQTESPPIVTAQDIANINTYRNTTDEGTRIVLQQKTPIRVLHRRPLLTRTRKILDLEAKLIPDQKQLFLVRLVTEAGTYVKEWVHGELGRTSPPLCAALGARADILALDVAAVDLAWPPQGRLEWG